jgi:uncharacterized protein (DUF433 family)
MSTEVLRAGTSWIEKTPNVCGGEACVRRTRHTVSGLVEWKQLGLSDEQILRQHPDLTLADLEAACSYWRQHPEEITEAVRANEEA